MKTKYWLLLLIGLLLTAPLWAKTRIVLLHPTVSNIEGFVWLTRNHIVDLPDLEMTGVYHAKEAYDYTASQSYLDKSGIKNYHLFKVSGELADSTIFKSNSCTARFQELFEQSDAILFFGGPDIQPSIYGQEQHLLTEVTDPYRHLFETSFLFHLIGSSRNPGYTPLLAARPDYVIRAFCLGMQTLNVAAGGTLIQDIPSQIYHLDRYEQVAALSADAQHRSYQAAHFPLDHLWGGSFHAIQLVNGGYLEQLVKKTSGSATPTVLSYHHQAAEKIGSNLKVIAYSMDGKVVEGLQHMKYRNVIGVQFHPEAASLYQSDHVWNLLPDKTINPHQLLITTGSLSFHEAFWSDFCLQILKNADVK